MKVAIYTIAKNESKFVEKFIKSCKGADYVIVGVDASTTDDTLYKLRENGANAFEINISPWRFDYARNRVLDAIPNDINVCISLDLDEILSDGWRQALEEEWDDEVTMIQYQYVYLWADSEQTIPSLTSPGFKIHKRHSYRWQHAIHENLKFIGENEKIKFTNKLGIKHYPDLSKPRKYNTIIDDAVAANPTDWWMRHIKARECFNHQRFEECLEDAKETLKITQAYFDLGMSQVRSEMCRLIARSLYSLKKANPGELQLWMMRALSEHPNQRENWVYLGEAWEMFGDLLSALAAYNNALQIVDRLQSPECEERCWSNDYIKERIAFCSNHLSQRE